MTVPYTPVPNVILETMQAMSESAESRLTAVLIRRTYGYHRREVRMTWDEMQELTGMSRSTLAIAIDNVERRGFFRRARRSTWSAVLPIGVAANSSEIEPNAPENSSEIELNAPENSSEIELNAPENSSEIELNAANSSEIELNAPANSSISVLDYSSEIEPSSIKEKKTPSGSKKKKSISSAGAQPAHPVWQLPPELSTDDFEQAWLSWFKHRAENGRYLTQTSGDQLLEQLRPLGAARAAAAIRYSIAAGWLSVHERQNGDGAGQPRQAPARETAEERLARIMQHV